MSILVVGASGLLGSSLVAAALDRDNRIFGTYHTSVPDFETDLFQLDIRNAEEMENILDTVRPELIINCAALTDVDNCEENPEKANAINAIAPGQLAKLTAKRNIGLIHTSTDYVFDGKSDALYSEDASPNPIQIYGKSKLDGEKQVRTNHPSPTIVRLSFVYGRHGASNELKGFPAWVTNKFVEKETMELFTDQHLTPTRAGEAADTILDLIELDFDPSGILHIACKSCISPYDFGCMIAEFLGEDKKLITKQSLNNEPRLAERPRNTCLSTNRIETLLERDSPTIHEDIRQVMY